MQIFCSVITFDKKHNFCVLFLIISAPCRLSPNEALPQTPLGALPLDPTSPLAPGLSVRFISRFARCFIFYFMLAIYSGLLCSFLIPHSSFLISHFSLLTPHLNSAPIKNFVGLSIILDTIIKKFDRRKPFEGTHRTVVCST